LEKIWDDCGKQLGFVWDACSKLWDETMEIVIFPLWDGFLVKTPPEGYVYGYTQNHH
jgi:hypothetical protein